MKCTVCGAPVPPKRKNKCSDSCRKRSADRARRKRDRVDRISRRWRVYLSGGVTLLGSDSYVLEVKGVLHVMARTRKEAMDRASAVLDQRERNGSVVPDEGLILNVGRAVRVGPGDVEELDEPVAAPASGAS